MPGWRSGVAGLERLVGRNSDNSSMPPSPDDLPGRKAAREDLRQEKSRRGPGAGAVAGVAISSWGWRRLGGYVGVG